MSLPKVDWYQSGEFVHVDVFVKNLQAEQVHVSFGSGEVVLAIETDTMQFSKTFALEEAIIPEKSDFSLGKVKAELKLAKAKTRAWKALERADVCAASLASTGLKYPTSAKKPVDEEKVTQALAEEPEPEPTGEAAVNALFKQIYANASEDTRRAMMKSFVESNGTVLSTNWEEVGGRTVDPIPPKTQ